MPNFLETGRLVLRAFTEADADHLLALDGDPDVMRFINGGRPTDREAIESRTVPRLLRSYPCLGGRGYWAAEEEKAGLSFVRSFTGDRPEAIEGSEHGDVEYELTRPDWRRRRQEPTVQ
ncbi:GNAT family N-acetyltransferase [Streptomyces syringium]|uniref:RimJ/RimL family protein N-acetyltransferase n=1 Tax=Streptomyces syringium TaxID=76729 RepID=A0ABS4XWA9_9ACTN|nr:GNAT family N-acetyltransferase [Streptomyces syringium]MBP2400665.1 RimJ/RimL family protein N-acetyltransferase [Streptomyces syringium]